MTHTTLPHKELINEDRLGALPYIFTAFLSAGLVFLVQPMFARMALPVLGGSPSVWNVSLVCFQAALLGGYIYAHLLARLPSVLMQTVIHGALLLVAALVLPLGLSDALGQPTAGSPTLWLVGVFALSIAPPFMAISATAPLIQAWYARSGRSDANDPYYLYAASNAGSLLGLIAYPLMMEPFLTLDAQTQTWALGYGVLALGLIGCGIIASRAGVGLLVKAPDVSTTESVEAPTSLMRQRLTWLALAFLPSSLLIGSTTHITTDIASAPFLWAPPLMIYIGSFIVVFSNKGLASLKIANTALPYLVGLTLFFLPRVISPPYQFAILLDLVTLFAAAIVCHGVMAKTRPDAQRLTEFYLIMSLGGVLGGAFNALLAPIIFNSPIEYPLVLALVMLARPYAPSTLQREHKLAVGIGLFIAALAVLLSLLTMPISEEAKYTALVVVAVALFFVRNKWAASAIAAACLALTGIAQPQISSADSTTERSFFGVVRTFTDNGYRGMLHGTTLHGAQRVDVPGKPVPLNYYAPMTPIGQTFGNWQEAENIGVIGLGVGSVACLADPNDNMTFFEIDPLVAKIALDPERFQFLSACAPNAKMVIGDGRLTLLDEPVGAFDLLLVDAFSSDSVPAHLLTIEALEIYMSRLSEGGVLMFHTSNRHLNLNSVLARGAEELGYTAKRQFFRTDGLELENRMTALPSDVVLIARSEADLARLANDDRWQPLPSDGKRPWTDDFTNIIGAILDKDH